jgi:hypothetical protein
MALRERRIAMVCWRVGGVATGAATPGGPTVDGTILQKNTSHDTGISGELQWRNIRDEVARMQCKKAYSTPVS